MQIVHNLIVDTFWIRDGNAGCIMSQVAFFNIFSEPSMVEPFCSFFPKLFYRFKRHAVVDDSMIDFLNVEMSEVSGLLQGLWNERLRLWLAVAITNPR